MQKKIKIKFVDFWDTFNPEDNLFIQLLKDKYEIELSEQPDYLFFSVFGDENLSYDCVKIFYTGENQSPDFNLCDYAIGYDYLSFGDRYIRFPYYYFALPEVDKVLGRDRTFTSENLALKTDFCSFVYSNNYASPEREEFLLKLSEYKKVSSGGKYKNNVGGPVVDKLKFQLVHKFSIAFENASRTGYTTEKLLESFAAQTIPIYWGDPLIGLVFNEDTFINCHNYSSFDEVIERVKQIDADNTLYLKMMQNPILINTSDTREHKVEQLRLFLWNIFDQPISLAVRYSRYYWQARNIKKMRDWRNAYNRSFFGLLHRFYKKFIWKQRRHNLLLWRFDRILKYIAYK